MGKKQLLNICSRFDVNNKWNKEREKNELQNKQNSLELEANLW